MSYKDNIRRVTPYTPGEQPKDKKRIIKLNTNENPYPPSKRVREEALSFNFDELRLYPDPNNLYLRNAISSYYDIPPEKIFVGVGSDDVLALSFLTFFNGREPLLFPDITYSFYDVWANLFLIPYEEVPLDPDFRVCISDYLKKNGGIVLPNPNAPTGISEGILMYEELIRKNQDSVVIIDEAYVDFGAPSVLPLIDKYENLLVVRTFSKAFSMAGQRVGYAFGNPYLIKHLEDVKFSFNSYTIDRMSTALATAQLSDREGIEKNIKDIIETRRYSEEKLNELSFSFFKSSANFIFAKHEEKSAEFLYESLKERGILVRHFNKKRIEDYLRITIGTREDMDTLFIALASILHK